MKTLFVILFAWVVFVFAGCGHFQQKEMQSDEISTDN